MRLGHLTLLYGYNYGATLQAFALQRTLDKMGHDSELLDLESNHYEHDLIRSMFFSFTSRIPMPLFRGTLFRLKYLLTRFLLSRKYRRLTNRSPFDNFFRDDLRVVKYGVTNGRLARMLTERYDAFICGSDGIWNRKWLHNEDFFLYFARNSRCKRVAYAPSFTGDPSTFSQADQQIIIEGIRNFDTLSCREETGCEFLKHHSGRACLCVVDPTLLITGDEWAPIMSPPRDAPKREYILSYNLGDMPWIDHLSRETSKALDYMPVYSIRDEFPSVRARARYSNIGPREFLWLYKHATFVVASSFHGAVFSIIFQKLFWVDMRPRDPIRVTNILHKLGLDDRLVTAETDIAQRTTRDHIDYPAVHALLDTMREGSLRYLSNALNGHTD